MAVNRSTLLAAEASAAELAALLDELTLWQTDTWGRAWREGADLLAAWADAWAEVVEAQALTRPGDIYRAANLAAIRARIERVLTATMQPNTPQVVDVLARAVALSDPHQLALIRTQLPGAVGVRAWLPTSDKALAAVVKRTTRHITARHYYLQTEAKAAVRAALRVGVAAGDNPRTVARAMTRRVAGVFNGGRNRADVIARTEILDAYRAANHASWAENRDLLQGWQWWAELSDRTCPSCVFQHGSMHATEEAGPIDHHRGRCTGIPVLRSWRSLGYTGEGAEPATALKRGDGVAWFKRQPETAQRQIMGPRRFEAWQAGDYPPGRWSVETHNADWRSAIHTSPAPERLG